MVTGAREKEISAYFYQKNAYDHFCFIVNENQPLANKSIELKDLENELFIDRNSESYSYYSIFSKDGCNHEKEC